MQQAPALMAASGAIFPLAWTGLAGGRRAERAIAGADPERCSYSPRELVSRRPKPTIAKPAREDGFSELPGLGTEPNVHDSHRSEGALRDEVARLEDELKLTRERVDELTTELATIRFEEEQRRIHDGQDPWSHFLRLPDAELITDRKERQFLEMLLKDGEVPLYLQAGEALWIAEQERIGVDAWNQLGGFRPSIILFLGPERILREAPPGWLREFCDEEEWLEWVGWTMPE